MIRPASIDEMRQRGTELIEAAAAETGTDGRVQWAAIKALNAAGLLLLLVVEQDDELVGHCCCAVGPELWSPVPSVTTLSVYVQPRWRGRWGRGLLNRLRTEALSRGCVARVQALPDSRLASLLEMHAARKVSVTYEL